MVARPAKGQPGLVQEDTTWGISQPLTAREDVRTVDEIEVYTFIVKGLPIIDARTPGF